MYTINKVCDIDGLYVLEPKKFKDERGYFQEIYNSEEFKYFTGIEFNAVQENESFSTFGVVRGLHYQKEPFEQAKLLKCLDGSIIDVALDIRKDSPTRGRLFSVVLSNENNKQLFIPKGFAHGFIVLSETARIRYLTDNYYAPDYESGVLFDKYMLFYSIKNCIDDKEQLQRWIDMYESGDLIYSEKDTVLPSIDELA